MRYLHRAFLQRRRHTYTESREAYGEDLWLITMSDLMSLLLIFFLVWYALKIHKEYKITYHQSVKKYGLLNNDPQHSYTVTSPAIHEGETVIELIEGVGFTPGKAELSSAGKELLRKIAPHIADNIGQYEVWVIGHSDNTPVNGGRWDSNIDLSMARAQSVWKYLVELGIPPTRLNLQGLGSLHPKVANDTPEHRRQNRRVEIVLRPAFFSR